jgi:hypothetical protein
MEMVVFLCPESCVTISNHDMISNSETRVNPEKRGRKSTSVNELEVMTPCHVWQYAPLWFLFHYKVKSGDSTTWFRILLISNPGLKAESLNAFAG